MPMPASASTNAAHHRGGFSVMKNGRATRAAASSVKSSMVRNAQLSWTSTSGATSAGSSMESAAFSPVR